MPREVHGPNSTPQPPKLPTGVGQGGVRQDQDRKNGGGQQGKKPPEPAPEPEEEAPEEEGHLDGDSFARLRRGNAQDFLTETRMPWEVAADERRAKLAEMRAKGKGATGPLSAARAQQQAPKGLPGRQPLSLNQQNAAPKAPMRPAGAGRQIDAGWDAEAAVNATFSAYQQLKDKQQERDRPAATAAGPAGAGLDGVPERGGPQLNKDAIAASLAAQEPDAPEEAAPAGPSWLVDPADAPAAPARPAPRAEAGGSMLAPRSPSGKLTPPDARPRAPKLQTGALSGSEPAAEPVRPRLSRAPLSPEAPKAEPEAARVPVAPQPPAEVAPAPVVEHESVAAHVAPAPPAEPEAPAIIEEPPVVALEELLAEEPMLQDLIAQVPGARGPKLACRYRVLDGQTQKPLTSARLEFEPVQDDRLPVVNGQVDFEGWYRGENIPPGVYQVTVRAAGYIPHAQTQVLRAGEVDEAVIGLKKP